jgi:hypothetical protein
MKPEIHNILWEAADATFDGVASASSSAISYDSGVVSLKLPTNLRSIALVRRNDTVKQVNADYEAGKPTFSGLTGSINGVDLSGNNLFFVGVSGDVLEIRYLLFS